MNGLDLVILGAAALAAYTGYRRGAILQVASYVGLAAGVVAGAALAPVVASAVESPVARAAIAVFVLLAFAAAGDALGWWVGRAAWRGPREGGAATMDAVAGSVVSVVAVLLVVWFLGLNLANGPLPEVSRSINGSAVIRVLDSALPRPPSPGRDPPAPEPVRVPRGLRRASPPPLGSVPPPTDAEVADAEEAGGPSTVQVVGEACGVVLEGSGFVAEPGYVVTNAHVVAGVDEPSVIEPSGPTLPAVPVLFDPGLDIAILFVSNADAPALPVLGRDVEDGTGGAVIGYPGGVRSIDPAAVLRTIQAIGRDIYGRLPRRAAPSTSCRPTWPLAAPGGPSRLPGWFGGRGGVRRIDLSTPTSATRSPPSRSLPSSGRRRAAPTPRTTRRLPPIALAIRPSTPRSGAHGRLRRDRPRSSHERDGSACNSSSQAGTGALHGDGRDRLLGELEDVRVRVGPGSPPSDSGASPNVRSTRVEDAGPRRRGRVREGGLGRRADDHRRHPDPELQVVGTSLGGAMWS